MKKEMDKLLKLVKANKPAHYEILKKNKVNDIFDSLKTEKEQKAFILLIILLTIPEYRKKFLQSKEVTK